ncbi:MAG: hypothetical protein CBC13_04535 [Planctomycetia bacterium TMED53]|nr:MAG: hypothetical protein CBC13_04535 [Planctomycetia bacterium TMED53]
MTEDQSEEPIQPEERIGRIAALATAARSRIAGSLLQTPLRRILPKSLPDQGLEVWLKMECCQVSGSFKARGATHFLLKLTEESSPKGVITYSSGNHGRALSEAAAKIGLPAVVVAPSTIDTVKADAVRGAGAELVLVGPTTDERRQKAEEIAEERDWVVVPPFDHDWIMAGQGTLVLEAIDQLGRVPDHIWLPVGGGGLSAGCAAVARVHAPDCQIHVVEPEGSDALARSLEAGQHLRCEAPRSEADGLLPQSVGLGNWQVLSAAGVISHRISDADLLRSLEILQRQNGIGAEPSGACAVTPLLTNFASSSATSELHVAVVSGGNVAADRLERLLSST